MIIELYPQYQLFKFTLLLNDNKEIFIKPQIESRAVNGTIINRAYLVHIPMLSYGWKKKFQNLKLSKNGNMMKMERNM